MANEMNINDAIMSTISEKELAEIKLNRYLSSNDPSVEVVKALMPFGMEQYLKDDPTLITNPSAMKLAISNCKEKMAVKQTTTAAPVIQTPAQPQVTQETQPQRAVEQVDSGMLDMSEKFVPGRKYSEKLPNVTEQQKLMLKILGY